MHQHNDEQELAAILDLDADVLRDQLSEATGWLAGLAGDMPVRRILDLGSGTGTGTFALLRRFADAEVVAVDMSPHMLHHLRARAAAQGLTDRVRTVEADLDAEWPNLSREAPSREAPSTADGADLAWMSAALHHMTDPDRTLRQTRAALRPGGLLAVVEMTGFPRFLPDDIGLGRPGLEARCYAVLDRQRAEELPHQGADWGPRLAAAGFAVEGERVLSIELDAPLPESAGRYAQAIFQRMRPGLEGQLDADDLAVLSTLIDSDGPDSLLRRDDLRIRTTRPAWVARRGIHPTDLR
jgi:SAM-dependent methyltransferase